MTLSDATTPGQSGLGSNGNKGYSVFPKAAGRESPHGRSNIPSSTLSEGVLPGAEMQSVLSKPQPTKLYFT